MLNIKIILIIIGLIIFILGIFNIRTEKKIYKTIYKIYPRNVYDEIFLSYPLQYNKEVFDNMNPEYEFGGEDGKFGKIYKDISKFGDKYDALNEINSTKLLDYLDINSLIVNEYIDKDKNDKFHYQQLEQLETLSENVGNILYTDRMHRKLPGSGPGSTIKNLYNLYNQISNTI